MSLKCLFGHKWNGCKCERCNATRDEGHKWVLSENKCIEKCSICGKERNVEHKWNGCKCVKCSETRDKGHRWILLEGKCIEECSICGETRKIEHRWNDGKCSRCGNIDEKAAASRLFVIFPISPMDSAEHEVFDKKHGEEIRAIGEALNKQGGMRSMREVGESFARKAPIHARKLEMMWNGIGYWRG